MAIHSPLSQVERTSGEGADSDGMTPDVVNECRERLEQSWAFDQDNREDAASDLRFLAGDHWPDQVRRDREAASRPLLTVNKLPQFLRQVTNPIREADLEIKVVPVDDFDDDELANIYNGLLKQIQYRSSAKAVYAQAAEHQSACGIGWFRIATDYVNDAMFEQEIKLKPIKQPLSVYDDPAAVEIDRSDAMWRCVTQMIPSETFKARWPKASVSEIDIPTDTPDGGFFWTTEDDIRVCEYWRKVPVTNTLGMLADGSTQDVTDWTPTQIEAWGVTKTREVDSFEVESYLLSGAEILEGPTKWPGKYIPIVPVIGSEVPLEHNVYRHGIIRFARDSQVMYNYYRTATTETIALRPKAPYLATPEMIQRHKSQWDTANTTNRPYLLYDRDPANPNDRPQREAPPEMPTALMQEAEISSNDLRETTGIYDASLGNKSNETSGVAINQRQVQGDTANYHYGDNLARSLEHAGRILIDLIPKIYDSERVLRLEGEDGEERKVTINQVIMHEDGQPIVLHDMSQARFDIRVNIGPSAKTKRLETANALFEFVRAFPAAQPFIGDLIAKNSDWPGAEQIAKRLYNMVPPQALYDPDDPEAPQPPNPMDDPMVRLEIEDKSSQVEERRKKTEKIGADIAKIAADIEKLGFDSQKVMADTDKTESETKGKDLENAIISAQASLGWHERLQPPQPPEQKTSAASSN